MEEDEREMIDHWSHEHPLTLVDTRDLEYCYGCEVTFGSGEQAYRCSIDGCEYSKLLHQECAALAREIRRPLHHPQHILIQRHESDFWKCSICERIIWSIGYRCRSSRCGFQMHLRCAHDSDLIDAATRDVDVQRRTIIRHPSHPSHDLKLLRRRCPFKCDACGSTRKGSSYTCTADDCQYWIHERCVSLPQNLEREDHHHSLSLSFHVPPEYIRFDYKCDFIVHLRCAVLPASVSSRRWDEHHPLLLTYNATLNRPGDFYCDQCETQMNPKSWMYHCRTCDISFHPRCFQTTSGKYRNMKLGQEYVNDATHPHTLTYQFLTTKLRCDICHQDSLEEIGFYCASCNFFMCARYNCGGVMIRNGEMKVVE